MGVSGRPQQSSLVANIVSQITTSVMSQNNEYVLTMEPLCMEQAWPTIVICTDLLGFD